MSADTKTFAIFPDTVKQILAIFPASDKETRLNLNKKLLTILDKENREIIETRVSILKTILDKLFSRLNVEEVQEEFSSDKIAYAEELHKTFGQSVVDKLLFIDELPDSFFKALPKKEYYNSEHYSVRLASVEACIKRIEYWKDKIEKEKEKEIQAQKRRELLAKKRLEWLEQYPAQLEKLGLTLVDITNDVIIFRFTDKVKISTFLKIKARRVDFEKFEGFVNLENLFTESE